MKIVVFDSHDNPAPNRSAGIDNHSALEVHATWTRRGGVYWMRGLPSGQYHISARKFSFSANQVVGDRWFYPGTTDDAKAELVEIGVEEPKKADI